MGYDKEKAKIRYQIQKQKKLEAEEKRKREQREQWLKEAEKAEEERKKEEAEEAKYEIAQKEMTERLERTCPNYNPDLTAEQRKALRQKQLDFIKNTPSEQKLHFKRKEDRQNIKYVIILHEYEDVDTMDAEAKVCVFYYDYDRVYMSFIGIPIYDAESPKLAFYSEGLRAHKFHSKSTHINGFSRLYFFELPVFSEGCCVNPCSYDDNGSFMMCNNWALGYGFAHGRTVLM